MNKDSVVFSYLAVAASRLINEMVAKHEDGEFLPEINAPHLYKRKAKVLASYCDLVSEIGMIANTYKECRRTAKTQFKQWIKTLKLSRQAENKLHFDSCFIDIGGDH